MLVSEAKEQLMAELKRLRANAFDQMRRDKLAAAEFAGYTDALDDVKFWLTGSYDWDEGDLGEGIIG